MDADGVPLIDIAPFLAGTPAGKRDVAERLAEACADIGFFAITGHGVPDTLIGDMRRVAHDFFALPVARKMAAAHPVADTPRGYRGLAGESLGRTADPGAPPDLKEFYHIGRDGWVDDHYHTGVEGQRYFIPNLWPAFPPDFAEIAAAYYRAMERLDADLMHVAALALDLPEDFFDDKIDRHVSAMRVNFYPSRTDRPKADQIRAGAHTDFGLFTLLIGEQGPGGLQVRTRRGKWIDVETRPDFIVVNIGDLFMRWTNDLWVSNPHRVVNPPPDLARTDSRLSIAFFHQPNYDAVIACLPGCAGPDDKPRYAPVRSGDYRDLKYREASARVSS